MKKRAFLIVAGCALSLVGRGETIDVIRGGVVQGITVPASAAPFQVAPDGVVFKDTRAIYKVDRPLGDAFTVKIRMKGEKLDKSAGSIVLFNGTDANHFIFSGSKQTMWLQGAVFAKTQLNRMAPDAVLNGEFFDLEIKRFKSEAQGDVLEFVINGESIVTIPVTMKLDAIGLRPWGGVLRIESFSITTGGVVG
jgi:hypothetical protein